MAALFAYSLLNLSFCFCSSAVVKLSLLKLKYWQKHGGSCEFDNQSTPKRGISVKASKVTVNSELLTQMWIYLRPYVPQTSQKKTKPDAWKCLKAEQTLSSCKLTATLPSRSTNPVASFVSNLTDIQRSFTGSLLSKRQIILGFHRK
ncbi:hypothetical protein ATANTOWER_012003 [Ataeniobius toweri]|uniref:Secreted protein n=1 Tax=Ataeniobius toweri TaxID=208326 RepID=A0ABU7AVC1_9TELE|nr:hypothetical protein [Ataeniobius toweri]